MQLWEKALCYCVCDVSIWTPVQIRLTTASSCTIGDEDSLGANDLYEYIKLVLFVYGKTMANVIATIGNNENKNQAIARRVGPKLLDCYSHSYSFLKNVIAEHTTIFCKVQDLVRKLWFQITAGLPRRHKIFLPNWTQRGGRARLTVCFIDMSRPEKLLQRWITTKLTTSALTNRGQLCG